jgi:hypothetical protein
MYLFFTKTSNRSAFWVSLIQSTLLYAKQKNSFLILSYQQHIIVLKLFGTSAEYISCIKCRLNSKNKSQICETFYINSFVLKSNRISTRQHHVDCEDYLLGVNDGEMALRSFCLEVAVCCKSRIRELSK